MWYQTLLVVMVISCLDPAVGEEETASSSTLDLIAQAECEARCYSIEEERNGSTTETEVTDKLRYSIPQCVYGVDMGGASEPDCRQKCRNNKDCVKGCSCVTELRSSPVRRSAAEGPGPSAPQLHCREATMLSVVWECSGKPVFVLLYRSTEESDWRPWGKTRKKLATLRDLTQGTLYQIRVLAVLQDGQLGEASTSDWISTLNDTFEPGPVSNIRRKAEFMPKPHYALQALVQNTITWEPAWDRTCFYKVVCFPNYYCTSDMSIEEREKFEHIMDYQELETNYFISIVGSNENYTRESSKAWLNFTTPDCSYYYPNDLTKCAPPKPENVSVEVKPVGMSKYDVTVSWAKPVLHPLYFRVKLVKGNYNDYDSEEKIVGGDSTSATFTSLILGRHLIVYVTARSKAGDSKTAKFDEYVESLLPSPCPDNPWNAETILLVILLATVIISVASFCIYLLHRNGKPFSREQERQVNEIS